MDKRKKPKYKIGDTVVITIYGTVGKITDVKWLDGMYVYEIDNSEGLFFETKLELLSEYKGDIMEKEQIDIEYRFFFGDLVQVKGYGAELFKVVGFRTEIWRYKDNAWEDVIYELARIKDGEWLEAGEEELILVADAESADMFIKKLGLLYLANKPQALLNLPEPKNPIRKREREELNNTMDKKEYIDFLLDVYNDYRLLYDLFHDDEYRKVMQVVLKKLTSVVNGDEINHS
ncbi:hypothetical protein [Neobacillus sp. LXY-4]|uniref:hypothetical protein n=1 Tax=Neobacillus sp. LXY-4 TaxID=3379826 RepID=UPI003EDEBF25